MMDDANALVARLLPLKETCQLNREGPSTTNQTKTQLTRLNCYIANLEEQLTILQQLRSLK